MIHFWLMFLLNKTKYRVKGLNIYVNVMIHFEHFSKVIVNLFWLRLCYMLWCVLMLIKKSYENSSCWSQHSINQVTFCNFSYYLVFCTSCKHPRLFRAVRLRGVILMWQYLDQVTLSGFPQSWTTQKYLGNSQNNYSMQSKVINMLYM